MVRWPNFVHCLCIGEAQALWHTGRGILQADLFGFIRVGASCCFIYRAGGGGGPGLNLCASHWWDDSVSLLVMGV